MNIFKDKATMPPDGEKPYGSAVDSPTPTKAQPEVVRVSMTWGEERALRMSNYSRYDAMDVKNLHRPRYGHGY